MCVNVAAEDIKDGDNKAEAEVQIVGRFPGVVCFYRTEKQRKSEFGKNEGESYIPSFGFDMYAPYLYGKNAKVLEQYPLSPHIMTAYTASVLKDKKKNKVIERTIRLYPTWREWIKPEYEDIKEKDKEGDKYVALTGKKKEYNYRAPFLYPKTASIELFGNILFPEKKYLTDGDDFIEHKKNPASDNEEIFFKLVKVDKNWNPIEFTTWDDKKKERKKQKYKYVGINEAEPVDEKEKAYVENELNARKQELQALIDERTRLETNRSNNNETIKKNNEPYTEKEANAKISIKKEEYRAKSVAEQEKVLNDPSIPDKDERKRQADEIHAGYQKQFDDYCDEIQKELDTHNKAKTHPDRPNAKADNELLEKENEKLTKEIDTKKEEIIAKRKEVDEIQARLDTEFYHPTDDKLELGIESYIYPFRADNNKDKEFTITINRTGVNTLNSALIAYYQRGEPGKETEHIVGQVNILAYDFYKYSYHYYTEGKKCSFPFYFENIPISFMQINVRDVKDNKVRAWNFNTNIGMTNAGLVNNVNKYFAQAGIQFRLNGELGMMEWKKKDDETMEIGKTEFSIVDNDGKMLLKTGNLDNVLEAEYSNYILLNLLYEANGVPVSDADVKAGKFPEKGKAYKNFLDKYPQLYNNRKEVSKEKAYYDIANAIASYLASHNFMVFLIDDVEGGSDSGLETTGVYTAAYTFMNSNRVFMFGSTLKADKVADTLAHELGHCLQLQHSFHSSYMMFPDKVGFSDSEWETKHKTQEKNDYKGYGATYDNIMDYGSDAGSKNGDYTRRSFVKKQWLKMSDSIVSKSKEVYENLFTVYKLFAYLDQEKLKEEEKLILGEENDKYVPEPFFRDILGLMKIYRELK